MGRAPALARVRPEVVQRAVRCGRDTVVPLPECPPMFRCHAVSILLATPLIVAFARPAATAPEVALQWPGEFHGEETRARDGETWLALRHEGARAWLEATVVSVEAVQDPVLDGEDERTGRRVSTPALAREPLVLLRGGGLVAGAMPAVPEVPVPLANPGGHRIEVPTLPAFELALACDEVDARPAETFDCRLELRDARRVQVLHVFAGFRGSDGNPMLGDDGGATLHFAGDLDRDGRVDLILDVRDHYNVQRTQLWLSGDAADGELLRLATTTEITGC